ncbi:nucleotide sugar dehydrogenase [Brenneria tiliae]|uniref:nucleotide sugar dehydrogenase n=1 Tax=Brenneria tiliae TaxID=2914984 RepID=UPI002014E8A5|nr:nucleotide sugar dehydrogenase [Brenneria tiliae]MCL2897130.1 nucleotide sugar dehydrogenase [Brenneria tiliae]MCL2904783.1 nucleotide sugar dehydrogenase [Brenneria tiliae]
MKNMHHRTISVIGLGYVGLPVAVAFGKNRQCIGFDINTRRIEELKSGIDLTREVESDELKSADILFTTQSEDIAKADFHIICIPTPINNSKQPDLAPLIKASKIVGGKIKKGDIVIYESTVYPGTTEEICVPVLENMSGLVCGTDFHVGYSPERINPGDKQRRFTNILKIVSAQQANILDIIADVYGSVVKSGVYKVGNIKVAETAKVIENTQRDLNIALMNELAIICNHLGIETSEVLEAASTKWNFLNFKPGLVGGHCIGVDPYYLTYKAKLLGYQPDVILAGRKINDGMGAYIASLIAKKMTKQGLLLNEARISILGLTFKENCPDIRNSKVIDLIEGLKSWGFDVLVNDPYANVQEVKQVYDIDLIPLEELSDMDAIVIAVAHDVYTKMTVGEFESIAKKDRTIFDIKGVTHNNDFHGSNLNTWYL